MFLDLFISSFGPIVLSTEERPSPDGDRAWKAIQDHFRKLEESRSTQVVGKARKDRRDLVHSALAGSVPTERVPTSAANRLGVA